MATNKDYGLKTLSPDEIYNLLPYIVRATDPNGAIRAIFNSLEELHNFSIQKLRELPRLQDPDQAGKFSPSDFGEDTALYSEYLSLIYTKDTRELSDSEEARMSYLATQLPQSLEARARELSYLAMLSDTVGATVLNKFFTKIIRLWIKTGILRNHINGTHSAVYLLGRALGFVDLKVSELWSRYAIKDPGEPKSPRNEVDFSYYPEKYPYYPQNRSYGDIRDIQRELTREDGVGNSYTEEETLQTPLGEITYTPEVVNDAGFTYTITFDNVGPDVASRFHVNLQVDNHNPFGNFTTLVTKQMAVGSYQLRYGTDSVKAYVDIPSKDNTTSFRFEAITYGDWANEIVVTVGDNDDVSTICDEVIDYASLEGPQNLTLEGPQSKIKFKSSYFDLVTAVDPLSFLQNFPAIPVTPIDNLEELGTFSYEVNAGSNTATLTFEDAVDVSVGDAIIITNSTSQYDLDGFEVNRNARYEVISVDGEDIVVSLEANENLTYDPSTSGYAPVPFISVSNSSGTALLHFEESIQEIEDGETILILNSSSYNSSGIEVVSVNALDNTLLVDTPYVGPDTGDILRQVTGGYPDGIIPQGSENPDYNGIALKVVLEPDDLAAGAFPVKGNTSGMWEQATEEDFAINLSVYYEVLAVVRRLFEQLRPATRTVRKDFNGLLLKDSINYAPLHVVNEVVLMSPGGKKFQLSVNSDSEAVWTEVDISTPSQTIVQRDSVTYDYYSWGISDAGEFSTTLLNSGDDSALVYYSASSDTERSAYVYLENGRIVASSFEPTFAVEEIHLQEGSEDYLEEDLGNVVESCDSSLAQWMPEEAFSTLTPSSSFLFQQRPEDSLTQNDLFQDHTYGHISIPWLQDAKFIWSGTQIVPVVGITNSDGFHEGIYNHYFNTDSGSSWHGGEFHGQDPRWDSRGVVTDIITPVKTGETAGEGLDQAYPIQFINAHNKYVWKGRVGDDAFVSNYMSTSGDGDLGPIRSDTSLSYLDGPDEPVTANWSSSISEDIYQIHSPEIEYPWKRVSGRIIALPENPYDSLENSSGSVKVVWPDGTYVDDLSIGDYFFFEDESLYQDLYRITEVGDSWMMTTATYSGSSDASDKSIWVKVVTADVWEVDAVMGVEIEAITLTDSGSLSFRVYDSDTSDAFDHSLVELLEDSLTAPIGYEGSIPLTNSEIDITQPKRTYSLCLKSGGFNAFVSLTQNKATGVLSNLDYGGSLSWQGGERDILEVTLLNPTDTSALDYNEGTSSSSCISVSTIWVPDPDDYGVISTTSSSARLIWRGGHFGGVGTVSFDSSSRSGIAPLMIYSGESGSSLGYLWEYDIDGYLTTTNEISLAPQLWELDVDGIAPDNSLDSDPFWTLSDSGNSVTPA